MFKTGALEEILLDDEWNKVDSHKLPFHLKPKEGHLAFVLHLINLTLAWQAFFSIRHG